jgi:fumarate hydratase class I
MPEFIYEKPFQLQKDTTNYRLLSKEYTSIIDVDGKKILRLDPKGLELLAKEAVSDLSFFLRTSHLEKLSSILQDPEATDNDRFVAYIMLRNTVISSKGELPWCQDTGTAIVIGKKGENVFTGVNDAESLSKGIYETYTTRNLRYSQIIPFSMFEEKNSGSNLPAQIDIYATEGSSYEFLFITKGGGSANKTYLYQQTKSLLKEATLKTVKEASAGYLDHLPTEGNKSGRAFRDPVWEKKIEKICHEYGVGAQFGGKYFVHDVRVIRLPRHAASCPVGMGVSCSADRNIKAKITGEGIFLEELEKNPARFMPDKAPELEKAVEVNLDRPMKEVLSQLTRYPVKTRLSLTGTLIVARDIAHARIKKMIDEGKPMPEYFKNHPVYYAGPAKTPAGMASGSFGPTTAGRMDPYVELFQSLGGSLIMLAKGNRNRQVIEACKKYGGFYLGSIGGPAAILAAENIKSVELVDFEDLGMEAVRKIRVENMPAFILTDDKGNDFFDAYNK